MIGILVLLSFHLASSLSQGQKPENDVSLCPIPVSEHLVTRRPTANEVSVSETRCSERESKFVQCPGELSGNYKWSQENKHKNYVLFVLNERSSVARVNVMYSTIQSSSQKPKVAFCDIPDSFDVTESNDFSGLHCTKLIIQGDSKAVLPMTFKNETSRVGMEVITQGIKTDFVVTGVQFFGGLCTAATTTTDFTPTSTSSDLIVTNSKAQVNMAVVDYNNRGIPLATQTVLPLLLMTTVLINFMK